MSVKRIFNSPLLYPLRSRLKRVFPGLFGGKTWIYLDGRNAEVRRKIQDAYDILEESESNSLLKKHLTFEVFHRIKDRKTKYGGTLLQVIRSGTTNLDSHIGVSACDPDAYGVFAELFDKIITDLHEYNHTLQPHPRSYFGETEIYEERNPSKSLPPLDPTNKYIKSTRIRCVRMLSDFPFNSLMSENQYFEIENKLKNQIHMLQWNWCNTYMDKYGMENPGVEAYGRVLDDHEISVFRSFLNVGKYYHLSNISHEDYQQLVKDRIIFRDDCRFLKASKGNRFWPNGRGVFFNKNEDFIIWVNEEDHLRFISMEKSSDVARVYYRLAVGVKEITNGLSCVWDDNLGWLTYGPANLGSTLRASVLLKLPKLSKSVDFAEICKDLNLQIREVAMEDEIKLYDVSNRHRLGLTELQALLEMYNGVKKLVEIEKK